MKKIIAAACLLILAGCYNDKQDKLYPLSTSIVCDTTNVTFGKDVLPILTKNCITSGCHDATASGGYDLRSFDGASAAVANDNQLVKSVTHDPSVVPMPQNLPKLSDCDINKIVRWVNLGAQNN